MTVTCPACDQTIDVDEDVELSEVIVCESCDRELEVASLDPVVLEEFEEEEK